jgi:hypothetical protein
MVSTETPICDFNAPAIDFNLKGVDGKMHNLQDCAGKNGLLVMVICNHCPYVKAVLDRIIRDTRALQKLGLNSVAMGVLILRCLICVGVCQCMKEMDRG